MLRTFSQGHLGTLIAATQPAAWSHRQSWPVPQFPPTTGEIFILPNLAGCGEVTCTCHAFCHSWHEALGYITQALSPSLPFSLIYTFCEVHRAQTQIKKAQGKEQVLAAAFLGCIISREPLGSCTKQELPLSDTLGVGPFFLWTHFCRATMVCSFLVPPQAGADPQIPQDFTSFSCWQICLVKPQRMTSHISLFWFRIILTR